MTASMGVSMWPTSQPHLDADELIRRADAAMYEVKHTGRNGYAVFHPSGEATSRRMHLLDLLSRAVTQERIVLHYQPIVQLLDERVVGVEALLRLRDDDGSLVYPLDFLDLAASTGMLLPIEHEVIQQACGQVARWGRDGHDLRLSVNVCVEQVSRINDFERTVRKALADSGLLAEQLVCELTEHALLSLSDPTLEGISRLVESGVRFSIDDFGTGYGSLTYVHAMPIHELKIDRSFVSASPQGTTGAILRSIASLAADLGMDCVAEGVETAGQQEMVREAGIHHAQGYLYAKPLEPDVLQQLLRERRTATGR